MAELDGDSAECASFAVEFVAKPLSGWRRQESGDGRQGLRPFPHLPNTGRCGAPAGSHGWLGSGHGLSPLQNRKDRPEAAFFFFYSISSEYQIESINRPSIFEGIRM